MTVDVRYTWVGPPAQQTTPSDSDPVRPDLMGPRSLGKARFAGGRPNLYFYCLDAHVATYRGQLRAVGVQVKALEREFGGQQIANMTQPDPDRATTVRYIMEQSMGGSVRDRVNAKNLWSLWCLYDRGGYHLDTGVTALPGRASFPAPKRFGIAALLPTPTPDPPVRICNFRDYLPGVPRTRRRGRGENDGKVDIDDIGSPEDHGGGGGVNVIHTKIPIQNGEVCMAIAQPSGSLGTLLGNRFRGQPTNRPNLDVWLMRSRARERAARRALDSYLELWFIVKRSSLRDERLKEAWRGAVMSAAFTGITHSRSDTRCNTERQTTQHYIRVQNKTHVPDLNLKKVGFGSHR